MVKEFIANGCDNSMNDDGTNTHYTDDGGDFYESCFGSCMSKCGAEPGLPITSGQCDCLKTCDKGTCSVEEAAGLEDFTNSGCEGGNEDSYATMPDYDDNYGPPECVKVMHAHRAHKDTKAALSTHNHAKQHTHTQTH